MLSVQDKQRVEAKANHIEDYADVLLRLVRLWIVETDPVQLAQLLIEMRSTLTSFKAAVAAFDPELPGQTNLWTDRPRPEQIDGP